MKFLILGDTHAFWHETNVTIAKAIRQHPDITHIVQVGDFGYGDWTGGKPFKPSKGFFSDEELAIYNAAEKMWIDGNHEGFDQLEADGGAWQPGWTHMPRGSVLEVDGIRMMFFGGASSIDKHMRTEGKSWWHQEDITMRQIQETLDTVEGPIDALFTHEHAGCIPYSDDRYKHDHLPSKGNRQLLDVLVDRYQPDYCFFGHHHHADQGTVGTMEWYCCPIIETYWYTIWTGYSVQTHWRENG
ncbi:MAG: metallophosphoesterase [Hydrogenophaga sp.]|uniref:metallophosphoesterase family protein n=1 Tax=Hydrogenophaga sp. TaxID=1904254 RepID=UPI00262FB471|nr:metallophosphoesterase [Hydrogenophaga sp.]MCV0439866.1 metallophosphoesterase [Hydrogenophaga sp.]